MTATLLIDLISEQRFLISNLRTFFLGHRYINYGKEQCIIDLDINGETAENVYAVKYLGDIFNSIGNNNDLIESHVKMGKQTLGVIQAFCKEIALRNHEIQIMLQFYESIFLSTVLFNCQSTNKHRNRITSNSSNEISKANNVRTIFTPNKGTTLTN